MSGADRRHAVVVARAVVAHLGAGATRPVRAAALLHDVGKVDSGLGPFRRSLVTVAAMAVGHDRARRWRDRPGQVGRAGRYLCHDEIGARLLVEASSDPLTVAWAREHHLPPSGGRSRPPSVPPSSPPTTTDPDAAHPSPNESESHPVLTLPPEPSDAPAAARPLPGATHGCPGQGERGGGERPPLPGPAWSRRPRATGNGGAPRPRGRRRPTQDAAPARPEAPRRRPAARADPAPRPSRRFRPGGGSRQRGGAGPGPGGRQRRGQPPSLQPGPGGGPGGRHAPAPGAGGGRRPPPARRHRAGRAGPVGRRLRQEHRGRHRAGRHRQLRQAPRPHRGSPGRPGAGDLGGPADPGRRRAAGCGAATCSRPRWRPPPSSPPWSWTPSGGSSPTAACSAGPTRATAATDVDLGDPGFATAPLIASTVAIVVIVSPRLTIRWRRACWAAVSLLVIVRIIGASAPPLDVIIALGVGLTVGPWRPWPWGRRPSTPTGRRSCACCAPGASSRPASSRSARSVGCWPTGCGGATCPRWSCACARRTTGRPTCSSGCGAGSATGGRPATARWAR